MGQLQAERGYSRGCVGRIRDGLSIDEGAGDSG